MDGFSIWAIVKELAPLLAVGGAWGGAKVALNGTRVRVKELDTRQVKHELLVEGRHVDMVDRLARIETKLDAIMQEKK